MHRILFGLTAAAALTFAAPERADAGNFFFGVSSGYGGYGIGPSFGYGFTASRAYVPSRAYAAPHVHYHRAPHVHPRYRAYSPRVPACSVSPYRYGHGRVHSTPYHGRNPYYRY